jgi:hypothetical protein
MGFVYEVLKFRNAICHPHSLLAPARTANAFLYFPFTLLTYLPTQSNFPLPTTVYSIQFKILPHTPILSVPLLAVW